MVLQYLKDTYKMGGVGLSQSKAVIGQGGDGYRLKEGRFRLDVKYKE